MQGLKGMLDSKRAVFALMNYLAIMALMFMGKLSVAEWMISTGGNTLMYMGAETANPSSKGPKAPTPASSSSTVTVTEKTVEASSDR